MAQLREKKSKEEFIRGQSHIAKSGEKITVLEPYGKIYVKIINGEGKLELISKTHLKARLGHGITATSD